MLFFKECKKVIRSLTFWIYCVIIALFFITQYFEDCREPVGPPYDGYKIVENHDLIMEGAAEELANGFFSNRYICYPFGFYKAVRLNEKEQKVIEKALTEITGLSADELNALGDEAEEYYSYDGLHEYNEVAVNSVPVDSSLTYERFTEIMGKVDKTLGGGSSFRPDDLVIHFSLVKMTKEDAQQEYEAFASKDRVTRALARLFCDYSGIDLAILPVFVAAALAAADRRRRMNDLIYCRSISSARLIFIRYAALVVTMLVPVLLTMIAAFIQALTNYDAGSMDMGALFTIPLFWLIPNIMEATAAGMLLTEVFSAGTAILVQFVCWFLSVLTGSAALTGRISMFTLVCRHNSLFDREAFMLCRNNFIFNRIFYMVLSLVMVILTVIVYELKRGGRFNGIRLFGKGGILRRKA